VARARSYNCMRRYRLMQKLVSVRSTLYDRQSVTSARRETFLRQNAARRPPARNRAKRLPTIAAAAAATVCVTIGLGRLLGEWRCGSHHRVWSMISWVAGRSPRVFAVCASTVQQTNVIYEYWCLCVIYRSAADIACRSKVETHRAGRPPPSSWRSAGGVRC